MDYTDMNGKPIDIKNRVELHIKKLKEEKKDKSKNQNIKKFETGR
jgi:hypothetical protein